MDTRNRANELLAKAKRELYTMKCQPAAALLLNGIALYENKKEMEPEDYRLLAKLHHMLAEACMLSTVFGPGVNDVDISHHYHEAIDCLKTLQEKSTDDYSLMGNAYYSLAALYELYKKHDTVVKLYTLALESCINAGDVERALKITAALIKAIPQAEEKYKFKISFVSELSVNNQKANESMKNDSVAAPRP